MSNKGNIRLVQIRSPKSGKILAQALCSNEMYIDDFIKKLKLITEDIDVVSINLPIISCYDDCNSAIQVLLEEEILIVDTGQKHLIKH